VKITIKMSQQNINQLYPKTTGMAQMK